MGRRDLNPSSRDDLQGRKVAVLQQDGDSIVGTCWIYDEHGVTLIATGAEPVQLHSPDRDPLPIAGYSHVPLGQVKLVQVPE